jgi:hypothetical protein
MPEQKDPPRPHGDILERPVEDNPAQRQSDAPPDATVDPDVYDRLDRARRAASAGQPSPGDQVPSAPDDEDTTRRKLYEEGATEVRKID